jgi:hypothetical protein
MSKTRRAPYVGRDCEVGPPCTLNKIGGFTSFIVSAEGIYNSPCKSTPSRAGILMLVGLINVTSAIPDN